MSKMATEKRLIEPEELIAEIEILYLKHYVKSYDKTIHDIFNAVRRRIRRLSTVEAVEVKHGRWIEKQEPIPWCEDDVDVFDVCSVCDCASPGQSNYCPNCGAKMDGDGNG